MTPKKVSALSVLLNLFLVIAKLAIGLASHSVALIAESLHSTIDVASAAITYVGINAASKPADKEHPYGHERYENIAGFMVTILLFMSAAWVLYESIPDIILGKSEAQFNIWGVFVMALAVAINFLMSRIKFRIGQKFSSMALVADSKNAKADVVSSVAVLGALLIIKFYPLADSIFASLVALYIFYEAYHLALETINALLDTANPSLERKIKRILHSKDVQFSNLKTRKIGSTNIAEVTLHFPPEKIGSVISPEVEELEKHLVDNIDELKDVYIRVKPVEFTEELVRPKFGKRYRYRKIYAN